jgi:hypothetical protein
MKTNSTKRILAWACSLLSGASVFAQSGGPFAITSSVIAGGGGKSTGGVFAVTGTLGQPATGGPLSGGAYTLGSGFWNVIQTPGAPLLRILQTGAGGAVISWPAPSTGWVLQQTTALAAQPALTVWTDVTSGPVVIVGSENTVTFTSTTGVRYFRLRRP